MILGFKEQHKGKPTYFKQRILNPYGGHSKIHTIRKGRRWFAGYRIHMATGVRTSRYHQFNAGIPSLSKCISVQDFEIERRDDLYPSAYNGRVFVVDVFSRELNTCFSMAFRVAVDGKYLTVPEMKLLAQNDGFDCLEDFFEWFQYRDFKGQIIHWTSTRY